MMTPEEINEALKKLGITKMAIARECGCSDSLVYYVVKGEAANRNVQLSIAEKLGKDVDSLFGPSTYDRTRARVGQKKKSYPRLKVQWHEFS